MNPKSLLMSWGMIVIGVVMNVLGMYLIKMKMNEMGAIEPGSFKMVIGYFINMARSPLALIGVILYMAAPLPYAIALSRMELSTVYPLSIALSCLIVVPFTAIFFGEVISLNKLIAIVMIVASLYFLYKV